MQPWVEIRLADPSNKNIKRINKRWIQESDEFEEIEYIRNFSNQAASTSLGFYTKEYIEGAKKAAQQKYYNKYKKEIKDIDNHVQNNANLLKLPEQGVCRIVPEDYCWHTLNKIIEFTFLNPDFIISQKGVERITRERNHKRIITTPRYCKKCLEYAQAIAYKLPLQLQNKHNAAIFVEHQDKIICESEGKTIQFDIHGGLVIATSFPDGSIH